MEDYGDCFVVLFILKRYFPARSEAGKKEVLAHSVLG